MDILESYVFVVQGSHIKEFDRDLYHQFVYFPTEMIHIFDNIIKQLYDKYYIANEEDPVSIDKKLIKKERLMCSIKSLDETVSLR
jgi:hypothetical protein